MNKKGLTLIELIVTIALLSMISLISFVSINKAIEKGKDNECANVRGMIKSAAKIYFSDHRYDSTSVTEVTVGTLAENKYLQTNEVKNPYKKNDNENLSETKATLKSDGTIEVIMPWENDCHGTN